MDESMDGWNAQKQHATESTRQQNTEIYWAKGPKWKRLF